MKLNKIVLSAMLLASASLTSPVFAGTWIEVSNGPGRITTYNGGGRFDAKLYSSSSSQTPMSSLLVTCVDFLNVFSYGERWEVNFTAIDGSQSLADTRYGGALNNNGNANNFDNFKGIYNAMDRYRMAAWLTSKLPTYASGSSDAKGIQGAIWFLLDPTGTPNAPKDGGASWTATMSSWLTQAVTTGLSQSTDFYSQFRVVSQVNLTQLGNGYSTRYQEFITTVVTPEPATWAALGIAMIVIVAFARRRQAKQAASLA
jgi:hypothetical protein